jgi:hypothetical protein
MTHVKTNARQSSGFAWLALVTTLLFVTPFAAQPASAGDSTINPVGLTANLNADLVRLFNSKDHPLPIIPVVVGQVDSREQVEGFIATGQHPTIFQISNADGPYATLAEVWMFSEIALEYPNVINFIKVPAGSPAAKSLYDKDVTWSLPSGVLCRASVRACSTQVIASTFVTFRPRCSGSVSKAGGLECGWKTKPPEGARRGSQMHEQRSAKTQKAAGSGVMKSRP